MPIVMPRSIGTDAWLSTGLLNYSVRGGGEGEGPYRAFSLENGVIHTLCTRYSQALTKPPDAAMLQLVLTTTACLSSIAAICAVVYFRRASGASPRTKQMRDLERTVSELSLEIEELHESHKRLRSREGMRDLRGRRKDSKTAEDAASGIAGGGLGMDAGPTAEALAAMSTAERKLHFRRKHFGGLGHIDFVKRQQQIEQSK